MTPEQASACAQREDTCNTMEASVESIAGGPVCKFDGGILFTAFGAMIITIQFMFNLYGT